MPPQHLVFDADDTLWENNVLFERAIDDYVGWLAHPTRDEATIRQVLLDIEAANAATHGYGSKVFLRSLHDCFERLAERPVGAEERAAIDRFCARLAHHEVELIPEVADTLAALGARHDLLLLTKGDPDEQQRKIDASGLAHHFRRCTIVAEKHAGVYAALAAEVELRPGRAWMIGNSIRSDVNPALEAGYGAVFIPNENTWALEHAELPASADRLLELERFADLLDHF